jgi:PiT family inorganic phosphate transporter
VTLSTWRELPVSTTHSIIGGIAGFGLIGGGASAINWETLTNVVASWVLSPFAGAALAFVMFRVIRFTVFDVKDPVRNAKRLSPLFIGITVFIILSSILLKTRVGDMAGLGASRSLLISASFAALLGLVGYRYAKRIPRKRKERKYDVVEGLFRRLQILTSCYVAFSHGANDVANAMGPLAVILAFGWNEIDTVYLLALGGVGLAIGISTWGYKVIRTVGGRITALTNTRGFSVDFAAATVVLTASKLGLPVSTSHAVVGSVIGVGLARGLDAVDLTVVKKIVYSWLLTLPATSTVAILIYRGFTLLI